MKTKKVITDNPKDFYRGKKVFVRVDFNVPIDNEQNIIREDYRIRRAIPTIDFLINAGAKVILGSHLGRPKGKKNKNLSLKLVAARLSQLIDKKVYFCDDFTDKGWPKKIDNLDNGSVVLLENLRFYNEETENDEHFSATLASLADIYVNDAFGTAHRAHASTTIIARFFENKFFGALLEKEVQSIEKVMKSGEKPILAIRMRRSSMAR